MSNLAPMLLIGLIGACLFLPAQTRERQLTDRLLDLTESKTVKRGSGMAWLGALVVVAGIVLAIKIGILSMRAGR